MNNYLFTSESVTEGHPDKVCDQISDAILDAIIKQDMDSRVACETMITTARIIVSAEITTTATVDYDAIIIKTLKEIGLCGKMYSLYKGINKSVKYYYEEK